MGMTLKVVSEGLRPLGGDGEDTEGRVREAAVVRRGGNSIQGHLASAEAAIDRRAIVTLHKHHQHHPSSVDQQQ